MAQVEGRPRCRGAGADSRWCSAPPQPDTPRSSRWRRGPTTQNWKEGFTYQQLFFFSLYSQSPVGIPTLIRIIINPNLNSSCFGLQSGWAAAWSRKFAFVCRNHRYHCDGFGCCVEEKELVDWKVIMINDHGDGSEHNVYDMDGDRVMIG